MAIKPKHREVNIMKFIKCTHYVESSFEGKPSFILLMKYQGIEKTFISNGCQFVEDTEKNRNILIDKYDCIDYLKELDKSPLATHSKITNGSYMFEGCNLTSFDVELPNLINGSCMFYDCNLTSFDAELPNLTNGFCMFKEMEIWEYLVETNVATEDELQLVTNICGYSVESLESVIYSRTGLNSYDQLLEVDGDD
jgi:hypothetical protein